MKREETAEVKEMYESDFGQPLTQIGTHSPTFNLPSTSQIRQKTSVSRRVIGHTVLYQIVGKFSWGRIFPPLIEFRRSSSILFHAEFREESNNIIPGV